MNFARLDMNLTRMICAAAVVAVPSLAGAQAGSQMQHAESSGWKELDAFHTVLAANWHPAAQGDTKAARAGATKLLDAALAWRKSKGPKDCDNAKTREGMTQMITELRWHADAVKRESSDDAVKVTLKTAHDTFEGFAEACMHHGPAPKKP
jgi:outer membrane murein-binding lipoprotein Lpp